jgi:hypothetical protein
MRVHCQHGASSILLILRVIDVALPSSCSHILSTLQPSRRKAAFTARSRCRLRSNLLFQYTTLELGIRLHRGQPCQKQLSINTTKRSFGKTQSGLTVMSARFRFQSRIAARTRQDDPVNAWVASNNTIEGTLHGRQPCDLNKDSLGLPELQATRQRILENLVKW